MGETLKYGDPLKRTKGDFTLNPPKNYHFSSLCVKRFSPWVRKKNFPGGKFPPRRKEKGEGGGKKKKGPPTPGHPLFKKQKFKKKKKGLP